MHIQAELPLDQLRQFACSDRLAGGKLRLEKGQHLALDLVRTARASLLWYQPRDTRILEFRLGLVKGRSRDAIFVGHLRHRRLLDRDATQHLVLHLNHIARIEESTVLKLRIADLLGRRIQCAVFGEDVGLRELAGIACWHVDSQPKSNYNFDA
jgi:hypothetical protein